MSLAIWVAIGLLAVSVGTGEGDDRSRLSNAGGGG